MNASVQFKTHSSSSGANKNTHILRNSEAYKNPNIITLFQQDKKFTKPKKEKPAKAVLKNEKERKSELKKINSAISVYTKRIEAITPPEDEEKQKRIFKMQEKLKELFEKREELKQAKEVPETRGRKQEHYYVEFEISLTNSNEYKDNIDFVATFEKLQNKLLNTKLFDGLELITNVIHLDQYSVHSHAMFKIPDGQTWNKHLKQFHEDGRKVYKALAKVWHSLAKSEVKKEFGIELEDLQSGKRYKSLRELKKEKPVQNLEKVEKINSRANMSEISTHLKGLVERVEQTREQTKSLFSKSKTSEAQERSVTSDSEQEQSQSNKRKNR